MSRFESPLDNIKLASPCSASWDAMYGNDRKRFCGDCKLNVYNLSGMTRAEAERLLASSDNRVCVRFFRRPDGTILTSDCPVGWANVKRRLNLWVTAVFSLMVTFITGVFAVSLFSKPRYSGNGPVIPIFRPEPEPLMGAIAVTPEAKRDDIKYTVGVPVRVK